LRDLTVGAEDVSDVTVDLARGWRLQGRVFADGAAPLPTAAELQRITVYLSTISDPAWALPSARVSADGTFATAEYPPGRYLVGLGTTPAGWRLESVMVDGRDVTDRPLNVVRDMTDLAVHLTRASSTIHGTVRDGRGVADGSAVVLLFPTDYASRLGDGIRASRAQRVRTTAAGGYAFASVPAGDYFAAAVPESALPDIWQSQAFLTACAPAFIRVSIKSAESIERSLTTVRR